MKITNFSFTLRQASTEDGYGDNYYVNINEDGNANVSHPYKTINHEEQTAILSIIQTGIIQYGVLVKECDRANKRLKLEKYAPKVSAEEAKAIEVAKLSAKQELELAVSRTGEPPVGTTDSKSIGADGDNPQPTIVITKVTEEDNW